MKGKTNNKWFFSQGVLILVITLLAVFFRARLILPGPLLPGINGGYYPVMVRELLNHGSLPFPDHPLTFWIEAALAKILDLFISNSDSSIIWSGKITDVLIPALMIFPLFSFAKQRTTNLNFSLLLTAFAVLFFPLSYLLTGDMHKNAIALVLLVGLFISIENWRSKTTMSGFLFILLGYLLLFLTHFGTAIIALLALPLILSPCLRIIKPIAKSSVLPVFFLIPLLLPDRLTRLFDLFSQPFRLFEQPFLWHILDGQWVYTPFLLGFGALVQILAIGTLIMAFRTGKGKYWAILGLALSSPLIGIEWYLRLTIISYIPLLFSWIVIWPELRSPGRKSTNWILLVLIALSVGVLLPAKRPPAIQSAEIQDLQSIKKLGLISENDMLIARHGLEWWTLWYLPCAVAQEQAVTLKDFSEYSRILVLNQFQDKTGRLLRGQPNFREPATGKQSASIYSGQTLQLSEESKESYPFYKEQLQLCGIGTLKTNKNGIWVLENEVYTYPLSLTGEQEKALSLSWHPDKKYRIYGKKRAFSLKIILDAFQEI